MSGKLYSVRNEKWGRNRAQGGDLVMWPVCLEGWSQENEEWGWRRLPGRGPGPERAGDKD